MDTNPILAELSDGDISKLVAVAQLQTLQPGDAIIREGVMTPHLFVLLAGALEVTVGTPAKQLAVLYPGELVGEMSFVDSRVSSAVVKAKERSDVLCIPRADVEKLITEDPAMGARLFRGIARLVVRRLRSTIQRLNTGNTASANAEVQLDRRLLDRLSARFAGK
jgi:CRP/FNR family transcriptional regulator, cyclic AMP receptor protein